jgi:hypothetical protein
MPEEQNVWGGIWNRRLNSFLSDVMLWSQLGQSNNDIFCEELGRKVGIDSVFAYKRNPQCNQQVVLVEAKTAERSGNLRRVKIEGWVRDLAAKLTCAPHSPEFHEKFSPDTDAQYGLGLIALWVREFETYSHEQVSRWLAQLVVPKKRVPINICFISNESIARLCAIHETIEHLEGKDAYKSAQYYFPAYGRQPPADGSCMPVEALLSKFVFCKARKAQRLKGRDEENEYSAYLVFYLGVITSYHDLRFIGLALKHFQLVEADEIEIYTTYDPESIRNHIETFQAEFWQTNPGLDFRQLTVTNDLPGWLGAE